MPTTVLGDGTTAFYSERHRADTDKEKAEMLVSYACVCQRCLFKFVKIVLLLSFNLKHVFKTLLGFQRSPFFLLKMVLNDKQAIIQSCFQIKRNTLNKASAALALASPAWSIFY